MSDINNPSLADLESLLYSCATSENDKKKAIERLKSLVNDNSDSKYAILLGKCYADGAGVEKDEHKAMDVLSKVKLNDDDVDAFLYLARLSSHQFRYKDAFRYYLKAAQLGNGYACYYIAISYYLGRGVEVDRSEASKWAKKSVEMGVESGEVLQKEIEEDLSKPILKRRFVKEPLYIPLSDEEIDAKKFLFIESSCLESLAIFLIVCGIIFSIFVGISRFFKSCGHRDSATIENVDENATVTEDGAKNIFMRAQQCLIDKNYSDLSNVFSSNIIRVESLHYPSLDELISNYRSYAKLWNYEEVNLYSLINDSDNPNKFNFVMELTETKTNGSVMKIFKVKGYVVFVKEHGEYLISELVTTDTRCLKSYQLN